jgi:hypothetical protein
MFQQGDVILVKVSEIKGKKLNHLILAEGEVTGHCHEITKGDAELYKHEGTLFLRVASDTAELTHQEHKTIILPKGDFEIKKVKEYDHFLEEARRVQD